MEDMNPHQDPPPSPRAADNAPDSSGGSHPAAGGSQGTAAGGSQGTAAGSARPATGAGFFGWIRSLGIIRGGDRWIGGVATGVSVRTGLDVVLVRGLFVVLAIFGGIGLLAYGLAWALLPEPDGRIHAESAARGSWTSGMTGALVISLLGLWRPDTPFFGNTGGFGGFIWSLFWIGAAVFIVYWISNSRNRNDDAGGTAPAGTYPAGTAPAGTARTEVFPPASPPTEPFIGPLRPSVRPVPKPAVPRPTGSDVVIFVGGALLFAALVLVLDYVEVLALGANVLAVALATGVVVLGLGIVLLGIRGRSSGALGFLAAVGIAATIIASSSPLTGNWVLADQGRWSMNAASPASEGYTVVAGQGRVDLTGLGGITEDSVIPVNAAAGNVGILVPDDVPVEVRSRMALSSTDVVSPGETTSTGGVWQPHTLHLNEDAEGPRIILEVRGVVSHITVATTADALQDTESRQQP
jgi:phage shock protein PspC (stress-responsive transcriptional regulator)